MGPFWAHGPFGPFGPFGALGPFGPFGPFGTLGPLGPCLAAGDWPKKKFELFPWILFYNFLEIFKWSDPLYTPNSIEKILGFVSIESLSESESSSSRSEQELY